MTLGTDHFDMLLHALTNQNELRLVTDEVAHGAAYALALVCAELRDAVFAHFTPQPGLPRFRTSLRDYMSTARRMEWALSTGGRAKLNRSSTKAVARHGYLGTLRWMCANGCRWKRSSICTAAAEGGHLEVLQWVRANCWPGCERRHVRGRGGRRTLGGPAISYSPWVFLGPVSHLQSR